MTYKLSLATGEVFNIEAKNIYQAIYIGDRYQVNYELELINEQ